MKRFLIMDNPKADDLEERVNEFLSVRFGDDILENVDIDIDLDQDGTKIEIWFNHLKDENSGYTPFLEILFANAWMPFYQNGNFFSKVVFTLIVYSVDPAIVDQYDTNEYILNPLLTC